MPKSYYCKGCDSVFFHGSSNTHGLPPTIVLLFFCDACGTQYLGEMKNPAFRNDSVIEVRSRGTVLTPDDCGGGMNEFVLLDASIVAETTFKDYLGDWTNEVECINCHSVGTFIRPDADFNNICPVCGGEDFEEHDWVR